MHLHLFELNAQFRLCTLRSMCWFYCDCTTFVLRLHLGVCVRYVVFSLLLCFTLISLRSVRLRKVVFFLNARIRTSCSFDVLEYCGLFRAHFWPMHFICCSTNLFFYLFYTHTYTHVTVHFRSHSKIMHTSKAIAQLFGISCIHYLRCSSMYVKYL